MRAPITRGTLGMAVLGLPLIGTFALLGACVAEPAGSVAVRESPIINGVASTADEDAAVWVGILASDGSPQGSCSGVLVAENVLLTARHCVSKTQPGGVACSKDGKPISGGAVLSDYAAKQLAVVLGPTMSRTTRASAFGQQVFTTGAKTLCNNDIALVVLDRKIAGAKIAQLRLDAPPDRDETISAVGWGVSNVSRTYGRNRRANIPITTVGPISTAAGSVGPGEFQIGEGICSGDSGGPAFVTTTGAVLGVVSRGGNGAPYDPAKDPAWTECVDTADYKTHNIYTRVDAFKDLILQAFEAAGAEPWLEGGPDPRKAKFGEPCDSPAACRSGLCVDVGGKSLCTSPCDDASACPAGYVCTAVESSRICIPAPAPVDPGGAPAAETTVKSGCAMDPRATNGGALALAFLAFSAFGRRVRCSRTR